MFKKHVGKSQNIAREVKLLTILVRRAKAAYSEPARARQLLTITCGQAAPKAGWGMEKRAGCRCAQTGGCWQGEAAGRLTSTAASYSIYLLYLVLSWKQGQNLGKVIVTDQVLAIWGQLLQKLLLGFLGYQAIVHLYILSLTLDPQGHYKLQNTRDDSYFYKNLQT